MREHIKAAIQHRSAGSPTTAESCTRTTRLAMQIDLGLGDTAEPPPVWLEYPQLLDPKPLRILGYTIETIATEFPPLEEVTRELARWSAVMKAAEN